MHGQPFAVLISPEISTGDSPGCGLKSDYPAHLIFAQITGTVAQLEVCSLRFRARLPRVTPRGVK
jgi:hypothetical protein